MSTTQIHLTPFFIEVDGCKVCIYEVLKTQLITGEEYYLVVVSIHYKNIKSRRYTLYIKNIEDLVNKLKIEVTKIKYMELTLGLEEVRKVIS